MRIPAITVNQDGSGIDLTDQPEGYLLTMSDPVADFVYARNAVTMVYDLVGMEGVRLLFKALEYGDEPHYPKDEGGSENLENVVGFGPIVGFDFDGVAVSVDGTNWFEIQGLRNLRSDKFLSFDLDLDAIVAGLGLTYGHAFRIRFCQYDDNPAPKDGFTISGIRLEGTGRPPVLHLPMNDNAPSPTVVDDAAGHQDQIFVDPSGDPNTSAHSVPGKVGTALSFDGVDDHVNLGTTIMNDVLAADHDFTVAFWWKRAVGNTDNVKYLVWKRDEATQTKGFFVVQGFVASPARAYLSVRMFNGTESRINWTHDHNADGVFHHYALLRRAATFEVYRDGTLAVSDTNPGNSADLSNTSPFWLCRLGTAYATGVMDDLRIYDRALLAQEIATLAGV